MKKNMGSVDRMIRLILALVIVILFLSNIIMGTLAIVLMVIAAILVLTSLISFCPLYALFGVNTCSKKK
jgi:hypothetical protein